MEVTSVPPQTNLYTKTHGGSFFFYRMSRCVVCKHVTNATSHDKCRTHADCARGPLYYGGFCGICHGLWDRANAYDRDPTDAARAFELLDIWITGFVKNSKGRTPGMDHFSDPEERRNFVRLRNLFKPRKRAASADSRRSSVPSQRVSTQKWFFGLLLSY